MQLSPTRRSRLARLSQTFGLSAREAQIEAERGSAILEVALLMPLFTLMLLVAAESGRLAYDAIEINNAAYAGAAYGAQNHATASNYTYMQQAATNDAADISGISATAVNSCACSNGISVTCSTAGTLCLSPAHIEEFVQVNTTATVNPFIYVPGTPTTFTFRGQAIMRVEQ